VFRDGLVRLISWSDPRCGRMLPVWVLMPAQVLHSVSHYVISSMVRTVWLQVLKATHREYQRLRGAVSRDPQLANLPGLSQYQSQAAALAGNFVADTLLFPLETVLHRLHLQGTRSIIDNLDSAGMEVTPILSRYEGLADCFTTILQEEGFSGLFKGFGAVILQYAVHFLIIKFSSKMVAAVATVLSSPPTIFPDNPSISSPGSARLSPKLSKESLSQARDHREFQATRQGEPTTPSSSKAYLNQIKEDVNNGAGSAGSTGSADEKFHSTSPVRPGGSTGLPSLLSFSQNSPPRKILPDDKYQF